jgi:hypothetical protein
MIVDLICIAWALFVFVYIVTAKVEKEDSEK